MKNRIPQQPPPPNVVWTSKPEGLEAAVTYHQLPGQTFVHLFSWNQVQAFFKAFGWVLGLGLLATLAIAALNSI